MSFGVVGKELPPEVGEIAQGRFSGDKSSDEHHMRASGGPGEERSVLGVSGFGLGSGFGVGRLGLVFGAHDSQDD